MLIICVFYIRVYKTLGTYRPVDKSCGLLGRFAPSCPKDLSPGRPGDKEITARVRGTNVYIPGRVEYLILAHSIRALDSAALQCKSLLYRLSELETISLWVGAGDLGLRSVIK